MKTINCPTSWDEIRLEDYLQFYKSIKPYLNTEQYAEKALLYGMFNFTDITEEVYLNSPESIISEIRSHITQLLTSAPPILVKSFELNGIKYGFIPSLDEMTYGEYLDLVEYTSKDVWQNTALIMPILYRPIVASFSDKYEIEQYSGTKEETIKLFQQGITMDVVLGAISFFLDLLKDLVIGTQIYLQEMFQTQIIDKSQVLMDLVASGLDITQLQYLQEMISSNLTELQSFPSTNA